MIPDLKVVPLEEGGKAHIVSLYGGLMQVIQDYVDMNDKVTMMEILGTVALLQSELCQKVWE